MNSQRHQTVSRRTLLKVAGATPVVAGGLTASGGVAAQGEEPVQGGTLTYGSGKPPQNVINPINTISSAQNNLIDALFLRLVYGRQWGEGMNPDLTSEIDLAVAETMTEMEQDRVWEFTLRQNVRWHDGQPVTADDVIFGIWLAVNKDAKSSSGAIPAGIKGAAKLQSEGGGAVTPPYTVEVEGATKLGDYALRIELERPILNYWVNSGVGYWPMPKHIFGQLPLDQLFNEPYATMPVGNGPFKAVQYVDGQYMEFEANEDFYLGRPYVDTYVVRFGDDDTLSAAMEAQEIDGTNVDAGPVYDRLTSLPYITGNPVPSTLPIGFAVNRERFPDEGAALTKAMMSAIDVPTLNEQLNSGTLRPSNYLFEHVVGLEQPPADFPTYSYDPERAQALLQEINWDANRELEWVMFNQPAAAEDAMQAMLAAVGIKATYRLIDVATVIDQLYRAGDYDIVHANFGGDQNMEFNWRYLKCGMFYDEGGYNYARYCNQTVDDFWTQALAATDPAEWKRLFDQATLAMGEDPPQATLWRGSVAYVWNNRVQGAYPYQYQFPVRPALERVWIKPEE